MLLALLYHKTGNGKYANSLKVLEDHFKWIASRYLTVLPGDPLPKKLSVCLTFDDAFFDFYYHVFPLLKKYHLKALLAVPVAYISETTTLTPQERLKKTETFSSQAPPAPSPGFCTWEELKELATSPYIQIASHSLHHRPLTSTHIDPEEELVSSKKVLEATLKVPIHSFVYPFGLWNKEIHKVAKKHYSHIFRIGNAYNFSWTNRNHLLYRVNADQLPFPHFPFTPLKRLKHLTRHYFNQWRGK